MPKRRLVVLVSLSYVVLTLLITSSTRSSSNSGSSCNSNTLFVESFAFQPTITASKRTTATTELYHNKNGKASASKTTGFGGVSNNLKKKNTIDTFPYSGTTRPGIISPQRIIVDDGTIDSKSIPDYAITGIPKRSKGTSGFLPWMIEVKTTNEIELMKESGTLARSILDGAGMLVKEGITTNDIDNWVHNEIIKNNAYPSPLNYHGYPKSCCTSINEVICHGIPDSTILKAGDIINIDITVYKNGYHGDCSEMFVVTSSSLSLQNILHEQPKIQHLLQTTYDCWISACSIVKPGIDYKEIGTVIEQYIKPHSLSTVKQFCGHGIGSIFHTTPNILHYSNNESNGQMAIGHTFTIEPMICTGSSKALTWLDDWTATTLDGSLSAQFEHTLLVTSDGVEALTGKTNNSPIQFWEQQTTLHPPGIWLGTSQHAIQQMKIINEKLNI